MIFFIFNFKALQHKKREFGSGLQFIKTERYFLLFLLLYAHYLFLSILVNQDLGYVYILSSAFRRVLG